MLLKNTQIFLAAAGTLALTCGDLKMPDRLDAGTPADCSKVYCYSPEALPCADESSIEVPSPVGYCKDGQCKYNSRSERCEAGGCQGGVCETYPCQGITCNLPPPNECSGETDLLVYAFKGRCSQATGLPECLYSSTVETCKTACQEGACLGEPCVGITCNRPPARHCEDGELVVYNRSGVCSEGGCDYLKQYVECDKGCDEGSCIGKDYCAWTQCDIPPASFCVGEELRVYEGRGVCDENGACLYAYQDIDCAEGCEDGQCSGDPCAGLVCEDPPASRCEDGKLLIWNTVGYCTEGTCKYNGQIVDCQKGCQDGQCIGEDLCAHITCSDPLPSYCVGSYLRVYESNGSCSNGSCQYEYNDILCPEGCLQGKCVGDPCIGVTCDNPPAAKCAGPSSRQVWDGNDGECHNGACEYNTQMVDCPFGCLDGECQGDPCAGVTCTTPPADKCDVNVAVTYHAVGTCVSGVCDYREERITCERSCEAGKCVACVSVDDCAEDTNECTKVACNSGVCEYEPQPGETCDDENDCTIDDTCRDDGVCTGEAISICSDDDGCCPQGCNTTLDNDCSDDGLVLIPAGTFWMGSPDGTCPDGYPGSCVAELGRGTDETLHQVRLTHDFEMMPKEVTQAQYVLLMNEQPCTGKGADCGESCPVCGVSWNDAVAYANALSGRLGYSPCYNLETQPISLNGVASVYDCVGFRLPTEAEWEYAIRKSATGIIYTAFYSGGITNTQEDPNMDLIGWYKYNSSVDGSLQFHLGGQKEPTGLSLSDMSGNLKEWVWDPPSISTQVGGNVIVDPGGSVDPGDDTTQSKGVRGGSFSENASLCRSAARSTAMQNSREQGSGFRLVRTVSNLTR